MTENNPDTQTARVVFVEPNESPPSNLIPELGQSTQEEFKIPGKNYAQHNPH